MRNEYDVIVVGAGPAGSMAAKFAAKKASVLLVDKHREIGSPKRCGEGLGMNAFKEFDLSIDRRFINRDICGFAVYAPNGTSVEIKFNEVNGYIIERKIFDKFLASEAARAGADVLADAEAALLRHDERIVGVKVNGEEITADIIIAADGVESGIAREAGINTVLDPYDIYSCFEYEMVGIDLDESDILYISLGNEIAPGGYMWIFPKDDDRANIGVGISGKEEKTARYYLDRFINSRPELSKGGILEVNVGVVPVGGFLEELVRDNVMVVGDAARQVNPLHGGGIEEAMIAGRLAGETAGRSMERDDLKILKDYENEWWATQGKLMKKILKVRHMAEKLTDEDMNYLAGIWGGDDLVGLSSGNYTPAIKKIVGHPRLLRILNGI